MEKTQLRLFFDKVKSDRHRLNKRLLNAMRGGKNTLYHNVVSQAISLDDDWIETLEQALFSVENIVKNPFKFIADEEIITDVSRAKRTTSKTVRHLAVNSQFVQSVDDSGEIRPKKLLATELNEDLAIYENRFVCTLIHRTVVFVENRYNDVLSKMRSFDQTGAGIITDFKFGTSDVELKLDLKVQEEPKNKVLLKKNADSMERIKRLRSRVKALLNTGFMKKLSNIKPVRPPIMKTNLLKMNVDYNNCYKLWLYISAYSFKGYSVAFKDKNLPVKSDFYDDITMICALAVQSLLQDNLLNEEDYADIPESDVKEKEFKVLTAYKFIPEWQKDSMGADESVVNEYYFNAMREELYKATRFGKLKQEKELKLSFARFCRALARINREMYKDVILSATRGKTDLREKTPLRKKEDAVKEQTAYLKRYRQLSRLKREESDKIIKAEARETVKLDKLKAALQKERERQAKKRLKLQREKERLKTVKKKGQKR